VLSPDYSRQKLHALVSSAQESIDFYFPYFSDDIFQELLFQTAQK
jgi:hypothetical protein